MRYHTRVKTFFNREGREWGANILNSSEFKRLFLLQLKVVYLKKRTFFQSDFLGEVYKNIEKFSKSGDFPFVEKKIRIPSFLAFYLLLGLTNEILIFRFFFDTPKFKNKFHQKMNSTE